MRVSVISSIVNEEFLTVGWINKTFENETLGFGQM